MPELPEVETAKNGISPHIITKTIQKIVVRQAQLRWPIPIEIIEQFQQAVVIDVRRRAKYIRIITRKGEIVIHLGMSGSLRICKEGDPVNKHDHVDFFFEGGAILRYTDPRRFGAILINQQDNQFPLFKSLGPEPLEERFDVNTLFKASRGRVITVKQLIMDSKVVVGVGNIYASESLFVAGISPKTQAGKVSKKRYELLVESIKQVLIRAIECGGTTLKDFVSAEGKQGYFQIELQVYGRAGEPCVNCKRPIKQLTIGQRSTFYCSYCQS